MSKDNRYKEFLDELLLSYECSHFEIFPDTECLWFEENTSLFIRGSDSIMDWAFNLLALPDPHDWAHFGYVIKARLLVEECKQRGITPSTVVGHSAGGAVAILVGKYFNCESYALACPKICTQYSKELLLYSDKNCVIINQEADCLTYLPPWFRHPVEPLVLSTADWPIFAHNLLSFE